MWWVAWPHWKSDVASMLITPAQTLPATTATTKRPICVWRFRVWTVDCGGHAAQLKRNNSVFTAWRPEVAYSTFLNFNNDNCLSQYLILRLHLGHFHLLATRFYYRMCLLLSLSVHGFCKGDILLNDEETAVSDHSLPFVVYPALFWDVCPWHNELFILDSVYWLARLFFGSVCPDFEF